MFPKKWAGKVCTQNYYLITWATMSEAVPLSVFKNCQQQRDRLWTENGGTPGKGFALFQTLPWPSPPGSEVAYFCRLQSLEGAEPVAPPLGACFHVTGTTSAARGTVMVDRWSRLTDSLLTDQLTCHLPTRSQAKMLQVDFHTCPRANYSKEMVSDIHGIH